jgi:LysM repeat protein
MKTYSYLLFFVFIFWFPHSVVSQRPDQHFIDYIDKYKDIAIRKMDKHKIPASITLAQGILESGGGKSDFARKSNNHFGIKCHDWKGDRIYRQAENPNDCFRSYRRVEDSYEDHALFLTQRQRYAVLFTYDIADYRSWAHGLKQCGYATDPNYPSKLIDLIHRYELHQYDKKSEHKGNKQSPILYNRTLHKANGLIYVVAETNDSYEKIASDMGAKTKDLLKYNNVPPNFPVFAGDIIYLEKKKKQADKPYFEHIVQPGESMYSISQKYGVQLARLYKLNKQKGNYVPHIGEVIRLR